MYIEPDIESGHGVIERLSGLKGTTLVVTMEPPWRLVQERIRWEPDHVHMITDMEYATLEAANAALPGCDTVIGVGGGSCCDTAKYLAWKRGCDMVLVPTIVSVDAPLTNMIAVRRQNTVTYVGDIWPERLLIDYDVIQRAPKELNRAGAGDIASIHTALFDWYLAHEQTGEVYDTGIAKRAHECLIDLERNADEIREVTPRGIDTIVDLYRREVEFCAQVGTSRPEEGSEHIVAYGLENLTGRHFIHGHLVALGIFVMARLQQNDPAGITELMDRTGLEYVCPGAEPSEVAECLRSLLAFKTEANLFFSTVDVAPITAEFTEEVVSALWG